VPANAEVSFNGAKTSQQGTLRRFVSPPLDPRYRYHYELHVQWMNGDRLVEETRRLQVRAGEQIDLAYSNPAPGEAVATSAAPRSTETRSAYVPPRPAAGLYPMNVGTTASFAVPIYDRSWPLGTERAYPRSMLNLRPQPNPWGPWAGVQAP
jgi:uncharacterized protein (TIGR03000 family)